MKIFQFILTPTGFLSALIFPCLVSPFALNADPLLLKPGQSTYETGEHARYFRDFSADLTLESIREMKDEFWYKSQTRRPNLLLGEEAIWVRFRVKNTSDVEDWVLFLDYPLMDFMDVFIIPPGLSQNSAKIKAGSADSRQLKALSHRLKVFPVRIKAGESLEFYIKVQTLTGRLLYFRLFTSAAFFRRDLLDTTLIVGFFIGLAFMVLINIGLYFSTRSLTPLYYIVALIPFGAYQAGLANLGPRFLFPEHPEWNLTFLNVLGGATFICTMVFWRNLLLLKIHAPRIDKTLFGLILGWVFFIFYALVPGSNEMAGYFINRALISVSSITTVLSAVIVIRQGFNPAWYSMTGWLIILFSALVFFMMLDGVFPVNTYLNFSIIFGFGFECLFFLAALSMRMKFLIDVSGDRDLTLSERERVSVYQARLLGKGANDRQEKLAELKRANIDVEGVLGRLKDLMENEKIYCDEDISLQRLAEMLEIAPYRLSEILNSRLGKSFFRYIIEYRIEEAKTRLLKEPDNSVLQIAYSVGFNSKSSFNTEFKKLVGETPSAFRKTHNN